MNFALIFMQITKVKLKVVPMYYLSLKCSDLWRIVLNFKITKKNNQMIKLCIFSTA